MDAGGNATDSVVGSGFAGSRVAVPYNPMAKTAAAPAATSATRHRADSRRLIGGVAPTGSAALTTESGTIVGNAASRSASTSGSIQVGSDAGMGVIRAGRSTEASAGAPAGVAGRSATATSSSAKMPALDVRSAAR